MRARSASLCAQLQNATQEHEELRSKYTSLASNTDKKLGDIMDTLEKISENLKETASKSGKSLACNNSMLHNNLTAREGEF